MPWSLQGRVAVVTGGSCSIGRSIILAIAQREAAAVYCVSRSRAGWWDETSAPIHHAQGDVTSDVDCERIIRDAQRRFGTVDLLVNCAGINKNKLFVRSDDDDIRQVLDTNVLGSLRMTRAALKHGGMLVKKDGCVIFIGSVVGLNGNPGQVAYAASKSALHGATASLAKEYGRANIRFNVVSPGLISDSGMSSHLAPEAVEKWTQSCALGRLGTPEDVADAVIAVATCRYINGQVVAVDGCMR